MFFYLNDDQEIAKKFQEQSEELRRQFPIGISFMPLNKHDSATIQAMEKTYHIDQLPSNVLFYNGKQVLKLVGPDNSTRCWKR